MLLDLTHRGCAAIWIFVSKCVLLIEHLARQKCDDWGYSIHSFLHHLELPKRGMYIHGLDLNLSNLQPHKGDVRPRDEGTRACCNRCLLFSFCLFAVAPFLPDQPVGLSSPPTLARLFPLATNQEFLVQWLPSHHGD